jgi:hypothetical protein
VSRYAGIYVNAVMPRYAPDSLLSGILFPEITKTGEKMGEKRGEGKRETAIYRVRSPRQTAGNDIKYPDVRGKKMSLYTGILHEDG